jgi:TRAP-type C4-dicarboxylate transport system permease small subunit
MFRLIALSGLLATIGLITYGAFLSGQVPGLVGEPVYRANNPALFRFWLFMHALLTLVGIVAIVWLMWDCFLGTERYMSRTEFWSPPRREWPIVICAAVFPILAVLHYIRVLRLKRKLSSGRAT